MIFTELVVAENLLSECAKINILSCVFAMLDVSKFPLYRFDALRNTVPNCLPRAATMKSKNYEIFPS